jgi:hypothetical protein
MYSVLDLCNNALLHHSTKTIVAQQQWVNPVISGSKLISSQWYSDNNSPHDPTRAYYDQLQQYMAVRKLTAKNKICAPDDDNIPCVVALAS